MVPRLGVESELQLPAYTTATATTGPSRICNLHCSQQRRILDPLSKARDQTRNFIVPSRIVSIVPRWELQIVHLSFTYKTHHIYYILQFFVYLDVLLCLIHLLSKRVSVHPALIPKASRHILTSRTTSSSYGCAFSGLSCPFPKTNLLVF